MDTYVVDTHSLIWFITENHRTLNGFRENFVAYRVDNYAKCIILYLGR